MSRVAATGTIESVSETTPRRFRRALRHNRIGDAAMSNPVVHNAVFIARTARVAQNPIEVVKRQFGPDEIVPVTIRETGFTVFLRKLSDDLMMFHQIIGADMYDPPPEVLNQLQSLGRPPRIADLGGNIGMFSVSAMKHYPYAKIIAMEPDPSSASVFQRTISANSWQQQIELLQAAAAVEDGTISFSAGEFHNSRVEDLDPEVVVTGNTTVDGLDTLPLLADRDLIKIDIEGSEWQILEDPRFTELPLRAVAMEWHSYGCSNSNPQLYAQELLERMGMLVRHDPGAVEACGTLWAWRT